MRTTNFIALLAAALGVLTGCTVKDIDQPALAGPSTFAHSILMVADRDTLTQNGSDYTDITIRSLSPSGQSENIPLRAQVFVDGVAQDFGTLSTKNPITPATIRYTAPASSVIAGAQTPTTVTIAVTPSNAGDFRGEIARQLDIRLIPQGVILPTNPNLVASFTFTPATPQSFQTVSFDASASTNGGAACASACSYTWNFGDGTTGSGQLVTHVYRAVGTFPVTLIVTDGRGAQATTSRSLAIANPSQPEGPFTLSPSTNLSTNTDIFFNASGVRWEGRTIVRYDWNFGDGRQASGMTTTHRYSGAGSYTVTLTLTDDLGAQGQLSQTVVVTTLGGATASLVPSTTSPRVGQRVVFDASGSVPSAGASIVSYRFVWGDGGPEEVSDNPIQSHVYTTTGTVSPTVIVTDSNGKTASRSVPLTVIP